ncbi:hypothetical protein N431DRAFT_462057 [Stipitochalara longipes BDJ]|nr:hypothetical protein N431DRAFT_462057 [Stipitochalara longipes BDJ]
MTGRPEVVCKGCKSTVLRDPVTNIADVAAHIRGNPRHMVNGKTTCPWCGEFFDDNFEGQENFLSHAHAEHPEIDSNHNLPCKVQGCTKRFENEWFRAQHLATNHEVRYPQYVPNPLPNPSDPANLNQPNNVPNARSVHLPQPEDHPRLQPPHPKPGPSSQQKSQPKLPSAEASQSSRASSSSSQQSSQQSSQPDLSLLSHVRMSDIEGSSTRPVGPRPSSESGSSSSSQGSQQGRDSRKDRMKGIFSKIKEGKGKKKGT